MPGPSNASPAIRTIISLIASAALASNFALADEVPDPTAVESASEPVGAARAADAEEEEHERREIEVIHVSAMKRSEPQQDVPVSIAVVTGETLQAQGIATFEEVSFSLPTVMVAEAAVGDSVFIRGVGSGVNQGFEQSIGTFIDGVYYGRGRSARTPFLDVERIEVLKGPQSVLFGKNTVGGAFNITSRRPTEYFEASLDAKLEHLGREVIGILSGPFTDSLRGRVAVRSAGLEGYVANSLRDDDEAERREWNLKPSLEWQPSDTLFVTLRGEYSVYDVEGRNNQLSKAQPLLADLVRAVDPAAEFEFDYKKSGPGTVPPFDREFDDTRAYNASLTLDRWIGAHTLTSINAFVGYNTQRSIDADFSALDFLASEGDQDFWSWAQELRLASPADETIEYIVGAYWSIEHLRNETLVPINFDAVPSLKALLESNGIPTQGTRVNRFEQDTLGYSFFGSLTWNATETLSVSAGLRFTRDEKQADKALYFATFGTDRLDPLVNATYPLLALGNPHEFRGLERDDNDFSPSARVEFRPFEDVLFYFSYRRGFKAGGFDADNALGDFLAEEFAPEKVGAFELGAKARLFDGLVSANLTLYRNEYDDLQVSTFDGVASFVVGNAASAISQGVDLELAWAATDELMLSTAVSYLDARYDRFDDGPCSFGVTTATGACDLSGKNLQFAPNWSALAVADWQDDLPGGLSGWRYDIRFDLVYTGDYDVPGDLDPFLAQDAFVKIGARLGVTSPRGGWHFAIVGKNLTDERTTTWGNDVPLSNLLGNNYFQHIDPPRSVILQLLYRYGGV